MRLGQVFTRLPSLHLHAGTGAGAVGHAKPHLSLAVSAAVSALELGYRQWLMVAGVCLLFILTIMPLLHGIKAISEKLEKVEEEIWSKDSASLAGKKPSQSSSRGPVRLGTTKLELPASLAATPEATHRPSGQARVGFHDDELNLAVAPGASEEVPAHGAPSARTATAPLGTRDADDPPEGPAAGQPWLSDDDAWPGGRSPTSTARGEESTALDSDAAGAADQQPQPPLRRSSTSPSQHHSHGGGHGRHMFSVPGARGRLAENENQKDADASSSASGPESESGEENQYTVNGGDIVDDMGISGMCLVCNRKQMRTVLLVAGQAFFLQALILRHLAQSLQSRPLVSAPKVLPMVIVCAAIYLHFIVCVADLPRSLFVLRWFHQVHQTWTETIVFGFIFIVDALITPMAQLFIGALFLCTSVTVVDVIMNSCAVSYISTIDNMILALRKTMNDLALDPDEFDDITFPVDPALVKALNKALVVVPVLPVSFSLAMGFLGLKVFML